MAFKTGLNFVFRMDGWANDLDLTFKRLTNGESDITGASQLEYVSLQYGSHCFLGILLY